LFIALIYICGPLFASSSGLLPTWVYLSVSILANGAEMLAALLILRKEGFSLNFNKSFRDRINWRFPNTWKQWGLVFFIFILTFIGIKLLSGVTSQLALAANIPSWMSQVNPNIHFDNYADKYPDVTIPGNILFLIMILVVRSFIFNILGEELYYRGVLQPKMVGVFGKWSWVANGILFAGKHAAMYWMIPLLIPVGLGLAYFFGPIGSLPLSILAHWIGNDLDLIPGMLAAVFGQ
jgi:membrane protease YdiL (CAAX protease family)